MEFLSLPIQTVLVFSFLIFKPEKPSNTSKVFKPECREYSLSNKSKMVPSSNCVSFKFCSLIVILYLYWFCIVPYRSPLRKPFCFFK